MTFLTASSFLRSAPFSGYALSLAQEELVSSQPFSLLTVAFVGMAIFAVAAIAALYLWWQHERKENQSRETMLYRMAQLEGRIRSLEEQGRAVHYSLLEVQSRQIENLRADAPPPVEEAKSPVVNQAPQQNSPQVVEILERHRKGQGVLQIAKEMGLGQGEVQLIVALEGSISKR